MESTGRRAGPLLLARYLRELRGPRTQAGVARALGVSQRTVSGFESGQRRLRFREDVIAYAEALGGDPARALALWEEDVRQEEARTAAPSGRIVVRDGRGEIRFAGARQGPPSSRDPLFKPPFDPDDIFGPDWTDALAGCPSPQGRMGPGAVFVATHGDQLGRVLDHDPALLSYLESVCARRACAPGGEPTPPAARAPVRALPAGPPESTDDESARAAPPPPEGPAAERPR